MLREVPTERISDFESELFEYLSAAKGELLDSIGDKGVIDAEAEAELKAAIEHCKEKFV